MTEWRKVKLGDICETQYGYTASAETIDTGTKFLRITDIVPDTIDWYSVPFCIISNEDRKKYILRKGDIVVARTGATVGYAKYIKNDVESVFASYLVRFKVIDDNADKEYVGLCVTSKAFKDYILSIANGSAQPNANSQMMSSFELALPSLDVQRRIAEVLSRYDALIENYQRQIKLLEEAAQRLYKEWFVDLRFPGHQSTPIINNLPQSWQKKKLAEIGKVITGKTPSTFKKENYGGSIPFITIPDMHNGIYPDSSLFLSDMGANSQKGKFIPPDSLMVSCIGTAGLVCISKENCQTNQQINTLVLEDKGDLYYLYFVLRSLKEHLVNLGSNGATMTNVNKTKFESIEIVFPCKSLIESFHVEVKNYFEYIKNLSYQIRNLSEARDRLLPKLMSAEIEV